MIPLPGLPAFWTTCTPAALPWSAASRLATAWFSISVACTELMALLSSWRVCSAYPVATSSSSSMAVTPIWKSSVALPPGGTVRVRDWGE